MSEITAEMIARGRFNHARSPQRRRLSDRVRETREQLMSAGAGQVVFDLELLRLYAEGRKAALWPQIILCLAVAAMAMVWAPPVLVALWLLQALSAVGVAGGAAVRFLYLIARAPVAPPSPPFAAGRDHQAISVKNWRARFVFAEACNGLTWGEFRGADDRGRRSVAAPWAATFVVVAFMLAAATHTVVTAFVPAAVYCRHGPHRLVGAAFHASG